MSTLTVSKDLLNAVLNAARDAGTDQMTLARVAGVAPETISRAKRRTTMDVATLDALAMAVGLKLTLAPHIVGELGGLSTQGKEARIRALWAYARIEAKQTGQPVPSSIEPRELTDCMNRNGDVLFISGDPNLDNVKRNIAVQVFLDFSVAEIIAFGAAWLKKWENNNKESWYQEWSEIITRGSRSELQDILLSAAPQRVRQRSSMPFAEMLGFDTVLSIKRRWRHEKV